MKKLHILFDSSCGVCWRCRGWLQAQPSFLELEFIPARSPECTRRFPDVVKEKTECMWDSGKQNPDDLIVISDEGGVYRGASAFIMCLYALEDYREWSEWLARPTLLPVARQAFELLSKNRWVLSQWLHIGGEEYLAEKLKEGGFLAEFLSVPEWMRWTNRK